MTRAQAQALAIGATIRDRRTGQVHVVVNKVYVFDVGMPVSKLCVRVEGRECDIPIRHAESWPWSEADAFHA